MGLQKPLDIRINPQLPFDCYRGTQFVHKIWLTNSSKGSLRHEMGHAYMSEKFPRLYKFFSKVLKPIVFLSEKFGLVGDMIYCAAFGTTLQMGILLAYTGRPLEISLPWILIGIGLSVPVVDEVMASFFGRKYRPKI